LVEFCHPWLATRKIDWDAAAVRAIPLVNSAGDENAFRRAVETMLAELNDPVTRTYADQTATNVDEPGNYPQARPLEGGVLLVRIGDYGHPRNMGSPSTTDDPRLAEVRRRIQAADAVVWDLRAPPGENGKPAPACFVDEIMGKGAFSSKPLEEPQTECRVWHGFPPEIGASSGGYWVRLDSSRGRVLPGAAPDSPLKDKFHVFLVNRRSGFPSVAPALRALGRAAVVADGGWSDENLVTITNLSLGEGVSAHVRRSTALPPPGGFMGPDVTLAESASDADPAFAAALRIARERPPPVRPDGARAQETPLPTRVYTNSVYPSAEYRLLAAFRLWNIIHYFFPYHKINGDDWDKALAPLIRNVLAAGNQTDYALVLAQTTARIHDSHVSISGRAIGDYYGRACPPLAVRMVEGLPVITQVLDVPETRSLALRPGDIVVSVDGQDALQRMRRFAPYVAASTPQSLDSKLSWLFLQGDPGSTLKLVVRDARNQAREVSLLRDDFWEQFRHPRTGDVYKILPGNIGYVDLDRLTPNQVDAMFEALKRTKGIVFDMRGYPNGTAWSIAPRLARHKIITCARFECPELREGKQTWAAFPQTTTRSESPTYKNPTVMLIDERTISQAEHTGLFLEAANGTQFIGTPTAGANGDVTAFTLPGGFRVSFTGQAPSHADQRLLQRVGLRPDLLVRPTVAGIRAGRDEVLEAATNYLAQRGN
jgi:C-terminal processing protease CtpA/Prc